MDSTEHYTKARRNVFLFSGLLALSSVIGISEKSSSATSLVPFELKTPDSIPHVLAVVLVFLVYDCGIQWISQEASYRQIKIRLVDFRTTVGVAIVSLLIYGWNTFGYIYKQIDWFDVGLFASVTIGLAATLSLFVTEIFSIFGRRRTAQIADQNISLEDKLLSAAWMLQYNPSSPNARKQVTFNSDGTVKDGRNDNEDRWRVRNGMLEFINKDGNTFSRFEYDPKQLKFLHTNDEDTLSLRGQYMTRMDVDKLRP